jgi:hypothetical protein
VLVGWTPADGLSMDWSLDGLLIQWQYREVVEN